MSAAFLFVMLAWAFLATSVQTYCTFQVGYGITLVGLPAELPMGALLTLSSYYLLDGGIGDMLGALGAGCLASYATTWGRAMGHAAHIHVEARQDPE